MFERILPWFGEAASVLSLARAVPAGEPAKNPGSVLDFQVQDIDGKTVDLYQVSGRGPPDHQHHQPVRLHPPVTRGWRRSTRSNKSRGFEVLAFPANELGRQELGNNAEIKTFCTSNYDVTFPLFSKIVVKGKGIDPLYQFLTSPETDPKFAGPITWNFNKFLVNRRGEVVARFESKDAPESAKVIKAIESALAASQ